MSTVETVLISIACGVAVSGLTTPVGVSGAVFLLPIQFSVLHVPSPAVTPTNLLFNVVSVPGALARYRRQATLRSPLTKVLVAGAVPGVVLGALIRVYLIPGPNVFRLVAAAVLLPLGVWLCIRNRCPTQDDSAPNRPGPSMVWVGALAWIVGVLGGIYGIGGGSLLSPILVGRGFGVRIVAPAALTATFVTSVVGAATYTALMSVNPTMNIAPNWAVGLAAGLGGLVGGYLGATLQPVLPERALRITLGVLAILTAAVYITQAVG